MEYIAKEEIETMCYRDLYDYVVEGLSHLLTIDIRIIANKINELLEEDSLWVAKE